MGLSVIIIIIIIIIIEAWCQNSFVYEIASTIKVEIQGAMGIHYS